MYKVKTEIFREMVLVLCASDLILVGKVNRYYINHIGRHCIKSTYIVSSMV